MISYIASFESSSARVPEVDLPVSEPPELDLVWAPSQDVVNAQLAQLLRAGTIPDSVHAGNLEQGGMVLGGIGGDRVTIWAPMVEIVAAKPSMAWLTLTMLNGNICFYNGFGQRNSILRQNVSGWKLCFSVGITSDGRLALHAAHCNIERSIMHCDNETLKNFFTSAVSDWLRSLSDQVLRATGQDRVVLPRSSFLERVLKPLLLEPLEKSLNDQPDFMDSRDGQPHKIDEAETVNEKSGVDASLNNKERAVFTPTSNGWNYRDHVLLHWQEEGKTSHDRESEQDLQFNITHSAPLDDKGVARPTVVVHGLLTRYEWDRVNQDLAPGRSRVYMGKGWARATLQWSLCLEFVARGHIGIQMRARKSLPVTDSGVGGMYIVSDPLLHLLNMHRIGTAWDGNACSLAAVQQEIVIPLESAFAAALQNALARLAPDLRLTPVDLLVNAQGDLEIRVVSAAG
ncbi:hypothetical protein MJ904_22720 [Massilia sp. MB5]|uniref:hypothetical protein n=1 Tax=Massilia sp. MB5 TaxID=2919578 RepID=UPI001F10B542|nr:hypothetical protein [Massilia sp. MB5]UMR29819.1 hypothetical protein MJ904_22720 [Massilia sp. MB5]